MENGTKQVNKFRFPDGFSQRSAIASINFVMVLVFVLVELGFSRFHFPTPGVMLLVAAVAVLYRAIELIVSRRARISFRDIRFALASISWGILMPFTLAAAMGQFHTHYFGLLVLPVLEAALYFSLWSTLSVAGIAATSALLWVAYAAHFTPPFQLGELLEAATLVLMLFIVGSLVWLLVNLLQQREQELRERLQDLELTRSQLIEGEKMAAIGRLASSVAHEIRNPVAIISSAIEAAASAAFSTEEREEMAKVALMEARRLEKLTTDFLAYAQPGTAPRMEVDAMALIGYMGSIARAQALHKQIKIDVRTEEGCMIFGNEDQLQQALLNLLRNAIDASPEFGHISVEVSKQKETVRISIENQGPSIPEYAVPKIFEPFFTAKRGGTGLGLPIARKIAERHGGEIKLERNAEECVLFTLLLPVYHADSSA